ncbi:MAG TPA: endonuclease MutS2 [Chloroflexi bacterium]|nr:endonuclease MutS2 [Chloroflexota bacterium]
MYNKHLTTLEFPLILDRLAAHTSFSAGEEKAHTLTPETDLRQIRRQLETTSEARALLEIKSDATLGGAHDVRPLAQAAQRGAVLPPAELLDVRDTLVAGRVLHRLLLRLDDRFPHLADVAGRIIPCPDLVAEIDRCLDERGNVRDAASTELARIRREERIAHGRLQDKLQHIIGSSRYASFLQEQIITQRDGRYVIPLKADFKGRLRGIVHDVSASGATVFVEPLSVVELNNTWRERQLEEEQEVHHILTDLSDRIAQHATEINLTVDALADLDLAFAKAKYADATDATAPEFVPLRSSSTFHPGSTIRLHGARHPLLDPKTVVPIDITLDDETHVLVLTGPNTGGKTVTLKTVGLLVLMAQAGMHIPADPGALISPFEAVYADIGDEQSIEQSLSTFSSHVSNILSFLDQADEGSLVLLDELGAGTDPAEGAALARALLDHFRQHRTTSFVATHYPELKTYAQLTPGVCNACVEFDPQTLSPTYKLTIGLPGRSNAFAIAQRLGMPQHIVEAAQQMISPDDLRTEDMLDDIHRLRIQAAQARDEANAARTAAAKLEQELGERLKHIDQERQQVLEQAQEEATQELETLRTKVRRLRQRLQAAAAPLETVSAVEETIIALEEDLPLSAPEPLAPPLPASPQRPLRSGDLVWVHPLNAQGRIIEVNGQENEAEVQMGLGRTRVRVTALELCAPPPEEEKASERPTVHAGAAPSPGMRLDLRGCTVEEALAQLDLYLDNAWRAELPWVHIIHGKGTGALRRAVRDFLTTHPAVSTHELGGDKEGGAGVTIAKLVS